MRSQTCVLCAVIICMFVGDVRAFSEEETNNVAIAILSYAAADDVDSFGPDDEFPVRYTDWNGLLDGVSLPGWTRQDKNAAVFDYLLRQSTNDLTNIGSEQRELIRIGLSECRDLNNTNALPVVRNLSLNPTANYMGEPTYLYYKWADLDADFCAVARTVLTNSALSSVDGKITNCVWLEHAIDRHKARFGCDERYTNVVHLVYEERARCLDSAASIDALLVSKMQGYGLSSNRLEMACRWLAATNCPPETVTYLVEITNRLMSVQGGLVTLP